MDRPLRHALVLGGTGFIGRSVVDALRDQGVEVTIVDRSPSAKRSVDVVTGDLRSLDVGKLARERSIDAVFNLSGSADVPGSIENPTADLNANVATLIPLLESLRHLDEPPLHVFASTAAIYGPPRYLPIDEEHPTLPLSPYAVSKLAAEHYVRVYARLHGLPSVSLRLFSVYGPGQTKQAVFDLLRRALDPGEVLRVHGPPETTRDFIFVRDVASAFVAVARASGADAAVYNLASGHGTTLRELAEAVLAATGVEKQLEFQTEIRPGDPDRYVGSPDLLAGLGIRLTTRLEDGLLATTTWLREAPPLGGSV